MLDLQERGNTPEPVALVAGDEADVRAELDPCAELDALVDRQLTYNKERGKLKKRQAIEEVWAIWLKEMDGAITHATPMAVRAEWDPASNWARAWLHLDYHRHVVTMYATKEDYWRAEVDSQHAGLVHFGKSYGSDGVGDFLRLLADVRAGKYDRPKVAEPTPAEKLTTALAQYIEHISQRYANE